MIQDILKLFTMTKLPKWLAYIAVAIYLWFASWGWYNANILAYHNQQKYEVETSVSKTYKDENGDLVTENRVLKLYTNELKTDSSSLAKQLRETAESMRIKLKNVKVFETGKAIGQWNAQIVLRDTVYRIDSTYNRKELIGLYSDSCLTQTLRISNDTVNCNYTINIPIVAITSMKFTDKWKFKNLSPFPWDWRKKQPFISAKTSCKHINIELKQIQVE